MGESFPERIEFEIDHDLVQKYFRQQAAIFCMVGGFPFGMIAFTAVSELLRGYYGFGNSQPIYASIGAVVLGASFWWVFAVGIYYSVYLLSSKSSADNLRLAVEGPYLRVVTGGLIVTDRRIHFKDLSDYCTQTGPLLRRLGMKSLRFRADAISNQRQGYYIEIPGLKNVDEVRDKLCLIDSQRESCDMR